MWAKKQKIHFGLSASKKGSFRVKFSLFLAEFVGDLCKQDCSLNGTASIQIAAPFLITSEFTPCTNLPYVRIYPSLLYNTESGDPLSPFDCLPLAMPSFLLKKKFLTTLQVDKIPVFIRTQMAVE